MTAYIYKEIQAAQRDEALVARLLRLWEDSVRATHHFLNGNDIESLKPFVIEGIKSTPIIYIARAREEPVAFMGIAGDKIEMLFVSPRHFGRGIGRRMVALAISNHRATSVDANEQNTKAVDFYRHIGFCVYERSATDDQGNPFPILRMRLK